jgi:CheY-like chemotaxis protein
MATNPPRRKVLVIEGEPSIRNVLQVLVTGPGHDSDAALNARQSLARIRQDQFDGVLLDLRSSRLPPDQMVCAISELRPSLVGRVLVITCEVSDPSTFDMLQRYALSRVSFSCVTSDLSPSIG